MKETIELLKCASTVTEWNKIISHAWSRKYINQSQRALIEQSGLIVWVLGKDPEVN